VTTGADVLILGAGAVGSHLVRRLPSWLRLTIADAQVVDRENLSTSCFVAPDCGLPKAEVAAARHRTRGGTARALVGDVCFTVRPGLLRAHGVVVTALDNVSALRDVVEALWGAAIGGPPLLVLTCGNEATGGGCQVRCFPTGRDAVCPCCLWGQAERQADRLSQGASCAGADAPRASAAAAQEAADLGMRTLLGWLDGDRSAAGRRIQRDRGGGEYAIRLPDRPVPGCAVPHHADDERVVDLAVGIDDLLVGTLAERALAEVGDDAVVLLDRRKVPMLGMACRGCGHVSAAPLRLLPAAAGARCCGCPDPPRALATRSQVGAHELRAPDVARLTLREFGSGPGDEVRVAGSGGAARLRARFDWSEVA